VTIVVGTVLLSGQGGQFSILGGSLTGSGFIDPAAPIEIGAGATVQPGDAGIGTLTFQGQVTFDGELDIKIIGASSFDKLSVLGNIDFGSGALIRFIFEDGFLPSAGENFDFLTADSFTGLPTLGFEGLPSGFDFTFDSNLDLVTAAVPGGVDVSEPATLAVLVLPLSGLALARCRAILTRRTHRPRRREPEGKNGAKFFRNLANLALCPGPVARAARGTELYDMRRQSMVRSIGRKTASCTEMMFREPSRICFDRRASSFSTVEIVVRSGAYYHDKFSSRSFQHAAAPNTAYSLQAPRSEDALSKSSNFASSQSSRCPA
jgi:hypothetical protein